MLKHSDINRMVEQGQAFEAYKEIRLYGEIKKDHEYTVESGTYEGEHRKMEIEYKGRLYSFWLMNGDIMQIGWNE